MEARDPRIAILVSGRGSNLQALLGSARDGALSGCCEVAVVFANRADAPALSLAREACVPTACLPSQGRAREAFDAELLALLEPFRVGWLVLAGYLRILSPQVIRRYPRRIVNIHPADTRAHQGLHGYRWAFEQGLASTMITVHLVDEGLDTGAILEQRAVDLRGADSEEEVERRGLEVEHQLYGEALSRLLRDAARGAGR